MHHSPSVAETDRRTDRQRRGDAAEAAAARYLTACGLPALERHFLRRIGEIDLIHVDPANGAVVFVEVRYRGSSSHGGALGSVGARKRRTVHLAARAWLQAHADPRRPARIDVIGMSPAGPPDDDGWCDWEDYRLRWIRNAF